MRNGIIARLSAGGPMPISKRRPAARAARVATVTAILMAIPALAAVPARAIVGGTEAPAGGAVMVLSSKGGVCTGVVLAPDTVLTAGHCLADAKEHRVHFRDAAGAPVLVDVTAQAVHPGYDAG